ncbi:MAG: hypothetical protein ACRYGK_19410 [Janthinobacterium lividum]
MYFADLTPYEYRLPFTLPGVLNVGWLEAGHGFAQADAASALPPQFQARLETLLSAQGPFDARVNRIRGRHPCPLCAQHSFAHAAIGSCELWLPSLQSGSCFAAPSMIVHTVAQHGYLPPTAFIEAVMAINPTLPFSGQTIYGALVEQRMAEEETRSPVRQ